MSSNPKNVRMCVVCRRMQPKQDLFRICRNDDNMAFVDYSFKACGRGAYVCKDIACVKALGNRKKVSKSLGGPIPENLIDQILDSIGNS